MKKRFSEEQIIGFLREAKAGMAAKYLCRQTAELDVQDCLYGASIPKGALRHVLIHAHAFRSEAPIHHACRGAIRYPHFSQ